MIQNSWNCMYQDYQIKKEGCVCNCLLINMNIEHRTNTLHKIYIKNTLTNNM